MIKLGHTGSVASIPLKGNEHLVRAASGNTVDVIVLRLGIKREPMNAEREANREVLWRVARVMGPIVVLHVLAYLAMRLLST